MVEIRGLGKKEREYFASKLLFSILVFKWKRVSLIITSVHSLLRLLRAPNTPLR